VKLYILYEKVDIELPGKLILSKYIISKSLIIEEVVLGYYRDLLPEILLSDNPEKIVVLFKDIYKTSESLIDILNLRGIKYLTLHEEEHRLFNFFNTNDFYNNLISFKYLKKIGNLLTLSQKTKEFFLKKFNKINSNNISIVGNPKYDYIKLIKKNFIKKQNDIKKNYILFALTESFFKTYKFYNYVKKNNLHFNLIDQVFFAQYNLKEMYCQHIYTKEKLKFLIKIAKENPKEKFLLRPHPSEKENLNKLKKFFEKQRNIEVNLEGSIYESIINSKLVISGPSSAIMDSLILEKPFLIFYDNENRCHRFSYGVHPTTEFKEKFIKFNDEILNLSPKKIEISEKEKKLIINYTNFEINSYEKIFFLIDHLTNIEKKRKLINDLFYKIFFRPIINQIIVLKSKKIYGFNAFLIFRKKIIYKILRYAPYIFFRDHSSKNYFFRHIFKLILGTSDNKTPDDTFHSGELEKINFKNYETINDILKDNLKFKDFSNTKLDNENKKIILTKKF